MFLVPFSIFHPLSLIIVMVKIQLPFIVVQSFLIFSPLFVHFHVTFSHFFAKKVHSSLNQLCFYHIQFCSSNVIFSDSLFIRIFTFFSNIVHSISFIAQVFTFDQYSIFWIFRVVICSIEFLFQIH